MKLRAIAISAVLTLISAVVILAQSASTPHFDAASIKLNTSGDSTRFAFSPLPGGRLSIVNNRMRNVILNAYGPPNQLFGAPDWIDSEHYDIEAKAEGNPTWEQIKPMLQALLEERLKLKLHRETRELPVYILTVAKDGPKLQRSPDGSCVERDPNRRVESPPPGEQPRPTCGSNTAGPGRWNATRIDMSGVTMALSRILRRDVINKTGQAGFFDIHLEFSPDALDPADTSSVTIFTALQEQLGLKLESAKAPTDVLIIDHAEKPDAN